MWAAAPRPSKENSSPRRSDLRGRSGIEKRSRNHAHDPERLRDRWTVVSFDGHGGHGKIALPRRDDEGILRAAEDQPRNLAHRPSGQRGPADAHPLPPVLRPGPGPRTKGANLVPDALRVPLPADARVFLAGVSLIARPL